MNSSIKLLRLKNLRKTMMKYDHITNKIIAKEFDLDNFFYNKKILMLSPFPSKERMNSQFYDDILYKTRLLKEVEKSNYDSKKQKLEQSFLHHTKELKEIDEIIGISQLNQKSTEEFIESNKIKNIWFVIDEINQLNNLNKLDQKYEILVDGMRIISLNNDPNVFNIAYLFFLAVYLFGIFFSFYCFVYSWIYLKNSEQTKIFDRIYKCLY
jgi:hypothetical protein